MEVLLDCLPCMLRQEASRMVTEDEEVQKQVLDEAIKLLSSYRKYCCSPDLAAALHGIVKKHTNAVDPYRQIKNRNIDEAVQLNPILKQLLQSKQGSLY